MSTYRVFTARYSDGQWVAPHVFVAQVDADNAGTACLAAAQSIGIGSRYFAEVLFTAQHADDPRAQDQRHITEDEIRELLRYTRRHA